MPALIKEREYRKFQNMEIRSVTEENGEYIIEGYATTFGEEYELFRDGNYVYREIVDKKAFANCNMTDVILQFDHEGRVYARVSNGTLEIRVDDHGLFIRANLGGTAIGRELYEEIKGGYITKMSFGFHVNAQTRTVEEVEQDGVVITIIHRVITGIDKLYDVSVVSIPANDATNVSCRNVCDGLIADILEERQTEEVRKNNVRKIKILMNLNGGKNQ